MCLTCGCCLPADDHGSSDNIVMADLVAAANWAHITTSEAAVNLVATSAQASSAQKASEVGCEVIKSSDEKRYTLGVAYPANKADVGKAADGFRDFAGPSALEEAAWSYMQKGHSVGLHHAEGTDGAGKVVESYVYRGPDWPQDNGYVVKAGDWLLGVIWDEPTWTEIKKGRLTGYSPQGGARRRVPNAEALAQLRS